MQRLQNKLLTIAIIALFGSTSFAAEREVGFPVLNTFPISLIAPSAMVWTTAQHPDGTLLFGCDGLVTFDGERWTSTKMGNGYALRGLDFDAATGKLWAAGNGELGWFVQDGRAWTYNSLVAKLPPEHAALGEVWGVYRFGGGALYVTDNKVLRWDGQKFSVWAFAGGRRLSAMKVGSTVFVSQRNEGVFEMREDGPHLMLPRSLIGDVTVFWMERRPDGWLLVTSRGLQRISQGKSFPFAPQVAEYLSTRGACCAARLPDGRLAVGTIQGGLIFLQPDGSQDGILTKDEGLPSNSVLSLFVDREQSLWATSPSQISRISVSSASSLFDKRAALSPLPITSISRFGDRIIVANETGLLELDSNTRRFGSFAPSTEVTRAVIETPEGIVIARNQKVERLDREKRETLFVSPKRDTVALLPSARWPGQLLVAAGNTIVAIKPDGQTRVVVDKLPDMVCSMAEDTSGRLWLGTAARGVYFARPMDDATVETATSVPELAAGLGWVASLHGGVFAITGDRALWMPSDGEQAKTVSNFPHHNIAALATDTDGGSVVWLVHEANMVQPACVARLSVENGSPVWRAYSVEGLEQVGAPYSLFVEGGSTLNSCQLWVGGATGLLRTTVFIDSPAPKPTAPLVRGFFRSGLDDALLPMGETLPYTTRNLSFELASAQFAQRASLRLETRLVGVDHHWLRVAGATRELAAVRDGPYELQARAVAETGETSPVSRVRFEILPPWWRTHGALLGFAVLGIAVIYGSFRWRVDLLRRRNRDLERKVQQRTEQLQQASLAKTQFVANMSHDIRNPLNGLVGLSLALEQTRLTGRQNELVGTMKDCAAYLSSLVDEVLDFATIEAGKVDLKPAPFSPRQLLQSVSATMKLSVEQKRDATLLVEPGLDLPEVVVADSARIQQVLVNYAGNALKYGGSFITVSAHVPKDAPDEIEFAVADDGDGISEKDQQILFTKFTRLNQGRTGIAGTGLGLASCRHLADQMGGTAGVKSTKGHGARFYLRIPLVRGEMQPTRQLNLNNVGVLLVEDADYNAWAATAVLNTLGLSCQHAKTGAQAIEMFAKTRHQIVLLDRNLPDMDGCDVARAIRAIERDGRHALLLAVSAFATAEDRELCIASGMDAFVGKPLTPDKLKKALGEARPALLGTAPVIGPTEVVEVNPPRINVRLLRFMAQEDVGGMSKTVENYLEELSELEAALTAAAADGDGKVIYQAAHRLMGHAKIIAAEDLADACLAVKQKTDGQIDRKAIMEAVRNVLHHSGGVREAVSDSLE